MAAHLPSLLRSVLDQWEFSDRELLRDEHERMNGVGVVADYEKLESDYVLYLIAKALGPVATPFSPPREVDSLWHAHLLNSAEYRRLETIVVTATGSGRKFLDHSTRTAGDHHGRARGMHAVRRWISSSGSAANIASPKKMKKSARPPDVQQRQPAHRQQQNDRTKGSSKQAIPDADPRQNRQEDVLIRLRNRRRTEPADTILPDKLLTRVRNRWPTVLGLPAVPRRIADEQGEGAGERNSSKSKPRFYYKVADDGIRDALQAMLQVNRRLRDSHWILPTIKHPRAKNLEIHTHHMCNAVRKFLAEAEDCMDSSSSPPSGDEGPHLQGRISHSVFRPILVSGSSASAEDDEKLAFSADWLRSGSTDYAAAPEGDDSQTEHVRRKLKIASLMREAGRRLARGISFAPLPGRERFANCGARLMDITLAKEDMMQVRTSSGMITSQPAPTAGAAEKNTPAADLIVRKAGGKTNEALAEQDAWLSSTIPISTTARDRASILHHKLRHYQKGTKVNLCFEPGTPSPQIAFRPIVADADQKDGRQNRRDAGAGPTSSPRVFFEIVEVPEPAYFDLDPEDAQSCRIFAPNPTDFDVAAADLADAWMELRRKNATTPASDTKTSTRREKKLLVHVPYGKKSEFVTEFLVRASKIVQDESEDREVFCLRPFYLDIPRSLLPADASMERVQRVRNGWPADEDPTRWKTHALFLDLYPLSVE
eukprot:g2714.t1